jgi:hypothetical protein
MSEARSAWTAARGALAVLAVTVVAVLVSAPAAQATDDGQYGFLPDKDSWCLAVTEPVLTDVGTAHAFVDIEYRDVCTFPAESSVELRTADSGWRRIESDFTKASSRNDKKYTKRTIRLSDLKNNTRYFVRSRIDYLTGKAVTNEITFKTGGDPAREIHAWGRTADWPNDQKLTLSAVIPDTAKNVPVGIWAAPSGYERFSNELVWKDDVGKSSCSQLPDHYSRCTWPIEWKLGRGEPNPFPTWWWWRWGLEYKVRLCIRNSAYVESFGMQCTKEFSLIAGKSTQVDVGQGP